MKSFYLGSLFSLLVIAVTAALTHEAAAQARLTSPTPRTAEDNLTTPPCGGVLQTNPVATYSAGASIPVSVEITQAFADTSSVGFFLLVPANNTGGYITYNNLGAVITNPSEGIQSVTLTLPAGVVCDQCILEMNYHVNSVQVYPDYYSCADITITQSADADASTSGDAGTTTTPQGLTCAVTSTPGASSGSAIASLLLVVGCLFLRGFRRSED